MKTIVLCSLFISLTWGFPKLQQDVKLKEMYVDPLPNHIPKHLVPLITNGTEVIPHSIPYQVMLGVELTTGVWICGGTLISPRHVLTAGHCIDNALYAIVYLGAHNLDVSEASQTIVWCDQFILHEDYNETDISNDIGIIVLDEPVQLNEYIDVVQLPLRDINNSYTGVNARVSGWGRVAGDQDGSSVLLAVNSTVIDNFICNAIYGIVKDSQLCISGFGGVGTCNGDAGGPLVYSNFLIGIVSYRAEGCPSGYPSGFTRITSYLDWIAEHTGLDI